MKNQVQPEEQLPKQDQAQEEKASPLNEPLNWLVALGPLTCFCHLTDLFR